MTSFIQGEDRHQSTLFPEELDGYIAEDNPVRVIDVFVDQIDLNNLGFKIIPAQFGRPAYHPCTMLKLFIYGYLNRVQSSRRLERESGRNVELMWLLGRLAPDFKTIADFRKDNTKSIIKVCREFVLICRKLDLFADNFVAIDGSKFKANNNRDKNYSLSKLQFRLKKIDENIAKYLTQIANADSIDSSASKVKVEKLQQKISRLKEEIKKLNNIKETVEATPDKQISLTDPDARSMKYRDGGIVGYNVQTVVDAKYHLIVEHEVTNVGNDRAQVSNMALKTKEVIGCDELKVAADMGYYSGEEIKACEENGITTYMPRPKTSGNKAKGLFDRDDFIYNSDDDSYTCPSGEKAIYRFSGEEKGKVIRRYWSSACKECPLKSKCTSGKNRRITRWEHEATLDALATRMDENKDAMKIRKSTVEHPFGTLKYWMGYTHFQMITLKKVRAEMSLHVLAYNLKRVVKILGTVPLIEAMRA